MVAVPAVKGRFKELDLDTYLKYLDQAQHLQEKGFYREISDVQLAKKIYENNMRARDKKV